MNDWIVWTSIQIQNGNYWNAWATAAVSYCLINLGDENWSKINSKLSFSHVMWIESTSWHEFHFCATNWFVAKFTYFGICTRNRCAFERQHQCHLRTGTSVWHKFCTAIMTCWHVSEQWENYNSISLTKNSQVDFHYQVLSSHLAHFTAPFRSWWCGCCCAEPECDGKSLM